MIKKIVNFLKIASPFLFVVLLWRLSDSFWNPGGIVAIIPIFYYSFIRPVPWFTVFAALFCFLIDYKFDTLLFWTSIYCFFYAANGFQNFVDLTRQKMDGWLVFMIYIGFSLLILSAIGFSLAGFFRAIWMFLWLTALYIPFTTVARKIDND